MKRVAGVLILVMLPAIASCQNVRATGKVERNNHAIHTDRQTRGESDALSSELRRKIKTLIGKLGSDEWPERDEAEKELGKIGTPALLPLIDTLGSKDVHVRSKAESILYALKLGETDVIVLEKKLENTEDNISKLIQKLIEKAKTIPSDPDGNFALQVSNQSFAIDPVDIEIRIDGRLAVRDDFCVDDQHSRVRFTFNIKPGRHKIEAVSKKGEAKFEKEFEITKKRHWAVIDYWYYPMDQRGLLMKGPPTPKHLSFRISDSVSKGE
ncbi:MAG: hypothetical protein E3J72_22000 [Planctomycetota bacterium]|nr:MAG: hypothetical protein E3J72_22000 [Planctomycetota bacterium]